MPCEPCVGEFVDLAGLVCFVPSAIPKLHEIQRTQHQQHCCPANSANSEEGGGGNFLLISFQYRSQHVVRNIHSYKYNYAIIIT